MSHRQESAARIEVLTLVTTLDSATMAARAGARFVDTAGDDALAASIRRAGLDVLVCGHGETADLSRDPAAALRGRTGLICAGFAAAEHAMHQGVPRDRIVVQVTPAELASSGAAADWRTLVDVDPEPPGLAAAPAGPAADTAVPAGAVATVCAWLGASIISTRHVPQVRRCLDMAETVIGTRPPAWAVRGLA